MSRLIDADELKDIIQGNEDLIDFQKEEMCSCVDACDAVYDVDKVDGIEFDSRKEATRYAELMIAQKGGLIKDLKLQPKFVLQESFKHEGKVVRAITYIADFSYFDNVKQRIVVEDVKGMETKEFLIKKKMFLKLYGEQYELCLVR